MDSITLIAGVGDGIQTACVMSLVSLQRGAWDHRDSHPCVSLVIRSLAIRLNDGPWWDSDAERTEELTPLAPLLAGTAASREVEMWRMFRCADWAVREIAPLALEARGRHADADQLRALAPIVDVATAEAGQKVAYAAEAAAANAVTYRAVYAASAAASRAATYAADEAGTAAATYAADEAGTAKMLRSLLHGLILELIEMREVA